MKEVAKVVPSFKARPEWIPWALRCINEHAGDYRAMEQCIASQWHRVSQRNRSPSVKNSLRAVFGPTLRHLQLVSGEGNGIELLAKGLELLSSYERGGEPAFKKAYGKHLIKLDRDVWANVLDEIRQSQNLVSEGELLARLRGKYLELNIDPDKLRKFLSHLEYAGLVTRNGGRVQLRELLLENLLQKIEVKLSDTDFFNTVHDTYRRLLPRTGGSPYVSIPELRNEVCKVTGMWPTDFDRSLVSMPKETREYIVHLSQPMLRQTGGIRLGDRYVYYIAVFDKGGNK